MKECDASSIQEERKRPTEPACRSSERRCPRHRRGHVEEEVGRPQCYSKALLRQRPAVLLIQKRV